MSQPGKMPKQQFAKELDVNMKDSGHWGMSKSGGRSNFGDTIERNSFKRQMTENDQSACFPGTAKNIFLEFL